MRIRPVLVVVALATMLSVTATAYVQAAGVDYWLNVVKTSNPKTYQDLNDTTAGTVAGDCGSVGDGWYEHVNTVLLGTNTLCWGGSQAQHSLGSPSAGATSLMLSQTSTDDYSVARTRMDMWPMLYSSPALGVMVWMKFDACASRGGHYAGIAVLHIFGDQGPEVYSNDCGVTMQLRDEEGGAWVTHSFGGPGLGRWFMSALVWSGGTLTYYTGYQGEGVVEHVVTGAAAPENGGGTWGVELGSNSDNGVTGYPNKGGFTVEYWGLGSWQDDAARGLLLTPDGVASGGLHVGEPATWLDILNAFTPFKLTPGTGCVATPSGPQDCGSNPTQQPAPISGSVKKFQIGYLPIVDCGTFPTVTITLGISVVIPDPVGVWPWIWCEVGDAINTAINALIFAANAIIDLILPDGSGLNGWNALAADAGTRFPLGFYNSAHAELAAGLGAPDYGSYACTGDANHFPVSCGYSGGDGSFTFTIGASQRVVDIPGRMYPLTHSYVGMMSAMVYFFFGISLLQLGKYDLAGNPHGVGE